MSDSSEQEAMRLKEKGNRLYKEGKYEDALSMWVDGLSLLDNRSSLLAISLKSNAAMAFLKTGHYELAVKYCNEILEVNPVNAKIHARRGTARERIANNPGSMLGFSERKDTHNLAIEDMKKCIDIILNCGEIDQAKEKLKRECEDSLVRMSLLDDDHFTRLSETNKPQGKNHLDSGLGEYLAMKMTPLPEHQRIPMTSMKEEMLAVRLLASMEIKSTTICSLGGSEEVLTGSFEERGRDILNKILTTVAQVPFCLFPATGSNKKCPPITIHLLAFYMRACLSEKAFKEYEIEEFCNEATSLVITDEVAYAIATHGYKEVEDAHSPFHGHGKSFMQSSKGCMPCCFRLLRAGQDDWADGLQQSAHFGSIEGVAFILNRLIEKVDGGRLSVVDAILKPDSASCNAMMHAANDTTSGLAGLTIRLLVQAVAFSTADVHEKDKNVRRILNTTDDHGYSPALASASLMNVAAMEGFVQVGARLWDTKTNGRISAAEQSMLDMSLNALGGMTQNPAVGNLIRALKTTSEERECCSYCGKSSESNLLRCSRCLLARYCDRECQKSGYKKHKYVCTSAKVDQDLQWYSSNISAPRP